MVFSGWAPGTPGKQCGTEAVPSTCASPPASSGDQSSFSSGCEVCPERDPREVGLSRWAPGAGERGWCQCCCAPSNAQSTQCPGSILRGLPQRSGPV